MSATDDINQLVRPQPAEKKLDTATTPAAIRAKTGLAEKNAGKVNGTQVTVKSTDGLFTFTVTVAKT